MGEHAKAPSSFEEGVGGGGEPRSGELGENGPVGPQPPLDPLLGKEGRKSSDKGRPVPKETLVQRARELRNNMGQPERHLWNALGSKQLGGFKFRRQDVIGQRILDFYCPNAKLAVEVDGDTHNSGQNRRLDGLLMQRFGVRTVRFTNAEVMGNREGVLCALPMVRQTSHTIP